ncbi:uncharacterized protein LOC128821264 [Vidua macroura]|uniref:uncharacterized protein LOC128821264 n=1 Tax=Vidua macroura TaxID=187451 RepID=UPI0023A83BFA|nr:uncharacterized protein LOC128821264 [Vidua macroura]
MEPRKLLEPLVAVVATLGEVVATVTGPHRGLRRGVSPKSLHTALRNFTWHLRATLGHRCVPSLVQALASLGATPGATWADVRAAASTCRESVATLEHSWIELTKEATGLHYTCKDVAIATGSARARDLWDKATCWGTAGDNLVATARQLPVALDREEVALDREEVALAGATHEARVAAATKEAVGEAMMATSWARVATRRGQWAEAALGPLKRLVAACDEATEFTWELQWRLRDIEADLEGTKEASPDVAEDLVAEVAEFEQLWEASARLFTRHLLGTLGDIHDLLLSPYGGRGGPGGPSSRAVAERCQKAIEDIPRLLQGQ